MIEFIVKENVFKTEVLFFCNCTSKELIKRAKKYEINEMSLDGYVCGTVLRANKRFFRIVWVEEVNKKNLGILIHELFHLVMIILRDKGVPVIANLENGEVGDETAAYLLEFYINETLKRIK
jgi:hypothetical protein